MANKTAFLSCRLDSETKKKFKQKARDLGLEISELIRKVAEEDTIFVDNNIKKLFNLIRLDLKMCDNCNTKLK